MRGQHPERDRQSIAAQEPVPGRLATGMASGAPLKRALARGVQTGRTITQRAERAALRYWQSPEVKVWRQRGRAWTKDPIAGAVALVGGMAVVTLVVAGLNALIGTPLPNPGTLYLPLVAMLAYHWGWRYALMGALLELVCVYFFLMVPSAQFKPLHTTMLAQLGVLAFVTGFVLALVQLARSRRRWAEREAGRFAALNRVGTSLTGELHEQPLLDTIASTARDLTGAEFAAFTLRPVDEHGQPRVPAEGHLFHLAAVVGVSAEQEALFRRMPLGGEGVLAPIFRHGVPVRVPDVLALGGSSFHAGAPRAPTVSPAARVAPAKVLREEAREAAARYVHGGQAGGQLRYVGVPRGHPGVRSFLGVPLLDSEGEVRGGLLLGHSRPDQFTAEDQALLVGLAAQAAVALENARLYEAAHTQAQELSATFESISDGVMLVDAHGAVLRENGAARNLRAALARVNATETVASTLRAVVEQALSGDRAGRVSVSIQLSLSGPHEYIVTGTPLWRSVARTASVPVEETAAPAPKALAGSDGVVVVWHDVSATHRLVEEQRARADAEARQVLLQTVIDELPSGVYLVYGDDARLVLANHAAEAVWGGTWTRGQPMVEFLRANGTRIFGPDGRELATGDLATVRAVREGTAVRHHQEVIRQPNGTSLPILLNAVALNPHSLHLDLLEVASGETGAETHAMVALVVLQDVTALKEAERLKDEFIGVAAHELRTPTAALKGFAEMLTVQSARGKGQPLDTWQQEALESIDQATIRLVDLIDDLLDVTRLQGGRLQLRQEPHDLVALVRRVVRRLAVTDVRHPITVRAEADYLVACVDPPRIEQVISNLIANAIKYSPDGGAITIELREDPATGEVIVAIHDRGIGIPAQQQAQVFGRFMRADNARDRGIGGTGLGLYLCRELVERHGGRIWFESTEGQGSTFFVALPVVLTPDDGDPVAPSMSETAAQ